MFRKTTLFQKLQKYDDCCTYTHWLLSAQSQLPQDDMLIELEDEEEEEEMRKYYNAVE